MDQPTTSNATKDIMQIDANDIGPLTTKMLKRMACKLKLDLTSTTKSIPLSEPVARTARYTGMAKNNLQKLLAFGDRLKYEHKEIHRHNIHRTLISTYIKNEHIPTITELFKYLDDELPIYVDLDYFTKMLIQMGYAFYKFPGKKGFRVMEKKTVTFERYRYLKSIQQYRKDNVPIVYIGFASLGKDMSLFSLEKTLETDLKNILNHILFTATDEKISNVKIIPASTYEVIQDNIKEWLLTLLAMQSIPSGSVCVLEDSKILRDPSIQVPTWKSVKADMLEWLEDHNVPCHISMTKAELLELIEYSTDSNENTCVLDNLVKTHNYSLLRIPKCISGLSIVPLVIRFLNDKKYFKESARTILNIEHIFQDTPSKNLNSFLITVQANEKQQLEEDIIVDDMLDDLVRKIKALDVEDTEDDMFLPTYSDSE